MPIIPCYYCSTILEAAGPGEFRKNDMVKLEGLGFVTVCKKCMKKLQEKKGE